MGVFKKVDFLSEKFAIAFGLGLSVDTFILLIRTSNIAGLIGIDVGTVYFVVVLGLAALLTSLVVNRKFTFLSTTSGVDLALLALILMQGTILLLYFQKYPIFPQYQSPDFANHVSYVQGLISGSISSIPQGLLYFGVHYQFAASLLLVGGEALITIQRTMALLITLSPLLFYFAAKKLFSNSSAAGLIAAMIFTFSGSIWYTGPLDAGLYPNFFGILAALFLLVSLCLLVGNAKSIGLWIFFVLALINGYMSHYTFLTLLPAVLLLPLFQYLLSVAKTRHIDLKTALPVIQAYLVPAVVAILPVIVPFALYPNTGRYALFLATSGGGIVTGGTTLSSALSSWPFLRYLAFAVYDDVEFVVLFILILVYLYKGIATKFAVAFIPIVWFLALAITAPGGISAWRFSYEALIPLTLMASFGIYALFPAGNKKTGRSSLAQRFRQTGSGRSPVLMGAIVIVLLGAIIVGAYGQMIIFDSTSNTSISSQTQTSVYNAIYWLKDNTPSNSSYLSVSDWRFAYTGTIIGRSTYFSFVSTPNGSISLAKSIGAGYIIVTNVVTAQVPNVSNIFPWNNFPVSSNSNLTLLYTNPDVRIYQIKAP